MIDGEHCISITEEEMETATNIVFKTKNGENQFKRVKHGHWELQETDELWLDCEWICSECKGRNDSYNKTNFCPNCGADMRESKEAE